MATVARQLVDDLISARVLPNDGVIERLAGAFVPDNRCLALICYPHCHKIVLANQALAQRILNDSLQGTVQGLGFVLGGTPEFLYDTRKGLYSYEALQSRLAANTFAAGGLVDLSGPVIQLENLSPEDLYVLLGKLRHVHAGGDANAYVVPDAALEAFLRHCSERIGDAYFRTPRNTIRAFIDLLEILAQNPGADWQELLGDVAIEKDADGGLTSLPAGEDDDDELASFRL